MEEDFNDIFASDSDESDFEGFAPVEDDLNPRIDQIDDGELNDDDLREIVTQIEREERDVFHEAYDCQWLRNFETETGPINVDETSSAYDIFHKMFNDDVFDLLVEQTNLYYNQYLQSKGGIESLRPNSRFRNWVPVTRPEMKVFIAIILYQGLVRMPNYPMYWSKQHLIKNNTITTYMTRDRFLNILTFSHACDNSAEPPRDHPDHDPGYKVTHIADMLVSKWQELYHPKREVSIDETLVPYKGRTKLLQYIPSKPHKWGLKVWTLADSKSGYVWNWMLYTGKKLTDDRRGAAHQVVMTLMNPLLNLGHHLYCDNYFTSPSLFDELADEQTGACGTLRANRIGVPKEVKSAKPNKGDSVVHRDDRHLYITWHDKRLVNVLTTVHSGATYKKRIRSRFHEGYVREVDHPKAVQLYTHYMGGVDLADQQTQYCVLMHKMLKWWKKLFLCNLLEVCVINSRIIFKELPPNRDKRIKTEKLRLQIIEGLLEGFEIQSRPFQRPVGDPPLRLTARHFLAINPRVTPAGRRSSQDCEVCSNRKNKARCQTQYYCIECDKPLCEYPCFKRYHTMNDYKLTCYKGLHTQS